MVSSENPISAAVAAKSGAAHAPSRPPTRPLRTRVLIPWGGRKEIRHHATRGTPKGNHRAPVAPRSVLRPRYRSAEVVAPLLVSSKRMQRARQSTMHGEARVLPCGANQSTTAGGSQPKRSHSLPPLCLAHRLPELGYFFGRQEPALFSIWWLFHAARRVVLDQFE